MASDTILAQERGLWQRRVVWALAPVNLIDSRDLASGRHLADDGRGPEDGDNAIWREIRGNWSDTSALLGSFTWLCAPFARGAVQECFDPFRQRSALLDVPDVIDQR